MEEYWFLAPMSRLAISSASLNIFFSETFHDNLPVARAKQLRPWLHETGTNSDRYDFRSVSIQMLLTVYMKPVWKIFSCRFHSFRVLNRHEWLRPVWSRTTEPCKHEPGRLYVGRWNVLVRAKRCAAVDWGLLKRGDSKFIFTHSNLDF